MTNRTMLRLARRNDQLLRATLRVLDDQLSQGIPDIVDGVGAARTLVMLAIEDATRLRKSLTRAVRVEQSATAGQEGGEA